VTAPYHGMHDDHTKASRKLAQKDTSGVHKPVQVDTTALKKRIDKTTQEEFSNVDKDPSTASANKYKAQVDTLETARGIDVSDLPEYKGTKRPNVVAKPDATGVKKKP